MGVQKLDLRPEFMEWPTTGCYYASNCLNCPRKICVHDEERNNYSEIKDAYEKLMLTNPHNAIKQLATHFGVHQRTIYRAIK